MDNMSIEFEQQPAYYQEWWLWYRLWNATVRAATRIADETHANDIILIRIKMLKYSTQQILKM